MREYENTAEKKYRTNIDPEAKDAAKELEDVIFDALKRFQPAVGLQGCVGQWFRKLGEHKDDIIIWLGVLPSDSFSAVCGVIKLVVSAAARMNHVRTSVMKALLATPVLLENTQRLLATYKHKETLISLCRAVYVSVLGAVGQILYYQRQKTTKQIMKAVMTPGTFERELLQKFEAIKMDRNALSVEVDLCQKEAMAQATAAGNAQIRDAVHVAIIAVNRKYSKMVHKIQGSFDVFRQNPVRAQDNRAVQAKTRSRKTTTTEPQSEEMKHLVELMTGCMLTPHAVQSLYGLAGDFIQESRFSLPFRKGDKDERMATYTKLLRRLDFDLSATTADLLDMYKMGPTMSRDDQERSVHVARSEKLAAWVYAPRSTALLVGGGCSSTSHMAMPFVCARMVAALLHLRTNPDPVQQRLNVGNVVPLYYFCGEHVPKGPDGGRDTPSGVANSLLAQLIALYLSRTGEAAVDVRPAPRLGKARSGDVKSVLHSFSAVLQQLPADTAVFCILDGLSVYLDNKQTQAAAEQLLQGLLQLTRAPSDGLQIACTFKLLLTAPCRFSSHVTSELAIGEKTLDVPHKLPLTGGFTAMKWHLSMEQQERALKPQ